MAYSKYFPFEKNNILSCVACVKQIPITQENQVQVGDHIIRRSFHCDHHLIVVKKHGSTEDSVDVTVVHSSPEIEYDKIGEKKHVSLHRDKIDITMDGKFFVVSYKHPVFSKDQVAERAIQRLKNISENREKYNYNLIGRNCEHFATWCATGRYFSFQVHQFLPGHLAEYSEPKLRKMHERKELCDTCYQRLLQMILEVPWKYTIPEKVNKGDIISYKYYWIWHDAVVVEKGSDATLVLVHYGANNIISTRRIITETVDFTHKALAVYDYSNWDVYSPAEVAERAMSRVGETKYSMVSNRSVHFAKWCKIRIPEI